MNSYIFVGLHPFVQAVAKEPQELTEDAKPLHEAIMTEIQNSGGLSNTIDLLMLENPKCRYTWWSVINGRISTRQRYAPALTNKFKKWEPDEIRILIKNFNRPIYKLIELLPNRSACAIKGEVYRLQRLFRS